MGAVYAHPVEHIIANLGPVGLALWVVNAGWFLTLVFVAHTSYETVNGHSQYAEERINSGRHYVHHEKVIYNYDNSPYFFDRLIGTYR
jgi:methylsterol monooxygenase